MESFIRFAKKGIFVKFLIDDTNLEIIQKIKQLNKQTSHNPIQFRCTDKLGKIDELVIIKDGISILQVRFDVNQNLIATLSNMQNKIFIQEILFEKFWNETYSLEIGQNN